MSPITVPGDLIHLTTLQLPAPLAAHVGQVGAFAVMDSLHRHTQFVSNMRPCPCPRGSFRPRRPPCGSSPQESPRSMKAEKERVP